MKMSGGADYDTLSKEIEDDADKLRDRIQSRLRPDLDRVAVELFAEAIKPELPEGWFWGLVNADGIFLRSKVHPDGILIGTHLNMALQPNESDGYVAWIIAKCLRGPRETWLRASIGISWSDQELSERPLHALRAKIQEALNQFMEKRTEMTEGGPFPSPVIL